MQRFTFSSFCLLLCSVLLGALSNHAQAATFTVVNTNQVGTGSLRKALNDANATPGADSIVFTIPSSGLHTIAPTSPLPTITEAVTIDGYSQPGATPNTQTNSDDAVILIELDGSNAGADAYGLKITGGNCTVRGLCINRFNLHGILMHTRGNNIITGNFIGCDPGGTLNRDNGGHGIAIPSGNANRIGGTTPAERNLLSGNRNTGVQISSNLTSGNVVQGNFIGTDKSGGVALGNGLNGIYITQGATNNLIGGIGSAARNIISGNERRGVQIANGANANQVQGNTIGLNSAGLQKVGNGSDGVAITESNNNLIGSSQAGGGNLISGNGSRFYGGNGVAVSGSGASNNRIEGNLIGTNVNGSLPLDFGVGNYIHGVSISDGASNNMAGGTTNGTGNLIGANGHNNSDNTPRYYGMGVVLTGPVATANKVQGNRIKRNQGNGIWINQSADNLIGGTTTGARNVITGNAQFPSPLNGNAGIEIFGSQASNNQVQGNYIGLDETGSATDRNGYNTSAGGGVYLNDAPSNTVGGSLSGSRNIISGNLIGVQIAGLNAQNSQILGNYIGTDASGTQDLGNGFGVCIGDFLGNTHIGASNNVVGGNTLAAANVISGNSEGIILVGTTTQNNQIIGNFIGTQEDGISALSNSFRGIAVLLGAKANKIGGLGSGTNTIAFNGEDGVQIAEGTGNEIVGNSIFSNGELGIDLLSNGVTANDGGDADSGANNLQNYPVLSGAAVSQASGTVTAIDGTLNSRASQLFRVDFYASPSADPSGFGEGKTYLGSVTVTTNGSGNVSFSFNASGDRSGQVITATATNTTTHDTSEFSQAVTVAPAGP